MLEELLTLKTKKQSINIILLSFFITIIGFISALILFPEHSSVAHVLITTILLIPLLSREIKKEEQKESRTGIKNFYRNHKSIFRIFFFIFVGVFLAYLLLTLIMVLFPQNITKTHEYQISLIENSELLTVSMIVKDVNMFPIIIKLISQNILLMLTCFVLSLFYGSGGMFLIILNASIFATFLIESMRLFKDFGSYSLLFLIYLIFWFIPVTIAFLLSAISGGVMSKALMHEKFHSKRFNNVNRDAFMLLLISLGIIIIGAVLQVWFTMMIV